MSYNSLLIAHYLFSICIPTFMVEQVFKYLSQPNEFAILYVLHKNKRMKMTSLWEQVGSSYAAIRNICARMEGYGLLKIESVPPKFYEVYLTEIGTKIAEQCVVIYDIYDAHLKEQGEL